MSDPNELADALGPRRAELLDEALTHYEVRRFYDREATLLDEGRLEEWLDLLTDDVTYRTPVRVTREKGAERSEFSDEAFNYREDKSTLAARVERFQSEFAWSEDPPSRVRHYVTNLRVEDGDGEEVLARTYLLLYRGQGEDVGGTLVSAERHDVLRRVDGDLLLDDRDVRLDHTILPTKNLSVFF